MVRIQKVFYHLAILWLIGIFQEEEVVKEIEDAMAKLLYFSALVGPR